MSSEPQHSEGYFLLHNHTAGRTCRGLGQTTAAITNQQCLTDKSEFARGPRPSGSALSLDKRAGGAAKSVHAAAACTRCERAAGFDLAGTKMIVLPMHGFRWRPVCECVSVCTHASLFFQVCSFSSIVVQCPCGCKFS